MTWHVYVNLSSNASGKGAFKIISRAMRILRVPSPCHAPMTDTFGTSVRRRNRDQEYHIFQHLTWTVNQFFLYTPKSSPSGLVCGPNMARMRPFRPVLHRPNNNNALARVPLCGRLIKVDWDWRRSQKYILCLCPASSNVNRMNKATKEKTVLVSQAILETAHCILD